MVTTLSNKQSFFPELSMNRKYLPRMLSKSLLSFNVRADKQNRAVLHEESIQIDHLCQLLSEQKEGTANITFITALSSSGIKRKGTPFL